MSRWFRWYEGTCEDGKFRVVARNARVTVATVMGVWATLLEDASNGDHRGVAVRGEDFYAAILDLDTAELQRILECMDDIGLISAGHGAITITKWKERQFETDGSDATNADRQRRWREKRKSNAVERQRNGSVTAAKRPDTDTDTDTEKKISRAVALDDWPSDYGDQFWQAYPRKTEKLAAMRKLASLRKQDIVTFADLMAGVKRYAATNPDPQYTKHPTTWLNAGCWADETQPGARNGKRPHDQARRSASSDFFAGIASVAEDLNGHDPASGTASEEIPFGRFNIDG